MMVILADVPLGIRESSQESYLYIPYSLYTVEQPDASRYRCRILKSGNMHVE